MGKSGQCKKCQIYTEVFEFKHISGRDKGTTDQYCKSCYEMQQKREEHLLSKGK